MAHHLDAFGREFLVHVAANVNIKSKRLLQVIHHVARTVRPPYFQRDLSPRSANPTSQQQVRNLDHVIGVQVCQEYPGDRADRHSDLCQANSGASAAVKEQPHPTGLDQCAWPELLKVDRWSAAGAKEYNLDAV